MPVGLSKFKYLGDFIGRTMQDLTETDMDHLVMGLAANGQWISPSTMVVRVGTACSGAELYLSALKQLTTAIERRTGIRVVFRHMWSIEINRLKRDWIQLNWKPQKLFRDIVQVANDGTGVDVISGVVQELDACDIVIAGTSCKDASMLSIHQSERRTAVSDASFTTGSTAAALVKIVVKCGARRVYMENVPGLKHAGEHGSNFDDLNSIWEAAGFEIRDVIFDAKDAGLPCHRSRLYMEASRGKHGAASQEHVHSVVKRLCQTAQQLSIEEFLLPEHPDLYDDWIGEQGMPRPKERTSKRRGLPWQEHHGFAWAGSSTASDKELYAAHLKDNPFFCNLSEREQDALLLKLCELEFPNSVLTNSFVALEMTLDRIRCRFDMGCLVPNTRVWLTRRGRFLLGVESLLLQGADPSDLPALFPRAWSNSFLGDLAGNAFCVPQFFVWLLVCFVTA